MTPEQEAQVRAYEEATEAEVSGGLAAEVAGVLAFLAGAWATYTALEGTGTTSVETLRAVVRRLLSIHPRVARVLAERAVQGAAMGVLIGRPDGVPTPEGGIRMPDDPALQEGIRTLDAELARRLEDVVRTAETLPMNTKRDLDVVTARGRSVVTMARARARWAANRAVSAGIARAAQDSGMRIVWVAERNACLHCYAYAGLTVAPGEDFPSGLTYSDRPLPPPPGGIPYPPLHPNCRCSIEPTILEGTDVALAREAARSVARGFSDYASEPARFRATDRLVQQGATLPGSQLPAALPRSVLDRAGRNLAARRYSQRHRPITGLNA